MSIGGFASFQQIGLYPASNLGYLASPPGQFFMGAKLFIGTPWMGNECVPKKIGLGYVKLHGFYGNP